jgi:prevent-host-death family protein
MRQIGIREFKSNASAWLRRVREGEEMTVTDRGQPIVHLSPVAKSTDLQWLRDAVARGEASWSGGKPKGLRGLRAKGGELVSETVLRQRR